MSTGTSASIPSEVSTPGAAAPAGAEADQVHRNEVLLIGRVAAAPVSRVLPSGDEVVLARLVVSRSAGPARPPRRDNRPDTIDCAAWTATTRRSVSRWRPEDLVEVSGALRRRFWRTAAGVASRYEVEVLGTRRIRRGG